MFETVIIRVNTEMHVIDTFNLLKIFRYKKYVYTKSDG